MRGIVTYDRRDLRALAGMGLLPGAQAGAGPAAGAGGGPRPEGGQAGDGEGRGGGRVPGSVAVPVHVFYEIKSVLGRVEEPVPGVHNMISCFGDNRAVSQQPDLAAVGPGGMRAVRGERYFDWDWVCPNRPAYRQRLLDLVRRAAAAGVAGTRLDTVSFPREGFCRCPRCLEAMAASGLEEAEWRAGVITGFIREAAALARRPLSLTLYPDPYGDHQRLRFGLDLAAVAPLVDFFVVPIYDLHYATTHWLETLVWGFRDLLGDAPFVVELYALNVDKQALLRAARVADAYADGVLMAYERAEEILPVIGELGPAPAHSRLAPASGA